MKKITLFAIAALAASTVAAAGPARINSVPFLQSNRMTRSAMPRLQAEKTLKAQQPLVLADMLKKSAPLATDEVVPGENEGPVTLVNEAAFRASNSAFYIGMTPASSYYRVPFGFIGIRNSLGFANLTEGTDDFIWSYDVIAGYDENDEEVLNTTESKNRNLTVPVTPLMSFYAPELKANFDGDTVSASIDVISYMSGWNTFEWGFYGSNMPDPNDPEATIDLNDVFGVYNCAAPMSATGLDDYTIDRDFVNPPADPGKPTMPWDTVNVNGVNGVWDYYFGSLEEQGLILEPAKIDGFTTIIPQQLSAYQLGHMWLYCASDATEDVVLTATIYGFDSDTNIDYTTPLGRATCTLPKGQYPATENDNMLIFEFNALEDGMALEMPPSINEPVAVVLTGIDNPAIRYFAPAFNANTTIAKDASEEVSNGKWPYHAFINVSVGYTIPATEGKEPVHDTLKVLTETPLGYTLEDGSSYQPSDMLMFFNIEFPVTLNPETGESYYTVKAPEAGGEASVNVIADYDLQALVTEELATVRGVSDDWFTFKAENTTIEMNNQQMPAYTITVTAEALPEGTEGRTGYIVYNGYGCDFAVTVNQGKISGIGEIAAGSNGGATELFDLQGRKLSAAPANGIYIERQGSKSVKRLAR